MLTMMEKSENFSLSWQFMNEEMAKANCRFSVPADIIVIVSLSLIAVKFSSKNPLNSLMGFELGLKEFSSPKFPQGHKIIFRFVSPLQLPCIHRL